MLKTSRFVGNVAAILAVAFMIFGVPGDGDFASRVYSQQTLTSQLTQQDLAIGADRLSEAFRGAAKVLRPSVVTVTSLVEPSAQRQMGGRSFGFQDLEELRGLLPEELLDQLRGMDGRNGGDLAEPEDLEQEPGNRRKIQTGLGSGVIVTADGYILTNNHVVSRADELQVELSDGRTFEAEVIGTDDKSDVAVLKIDAVNLVAARLGDSSAMEVGDWVIAIGSPFGLNQTVTAGIISAMNRRPDIINGGYEDFLQTDAAINPGNSGGPLVNLRGEVVGINTAINSRTGTNAGVGFAIPSNMASRIMEDLKQNGRVQRGYIGAFLNEVTAKNASEYQLPEGIIRGAVIERVMPDGPAERGNLKPGDVVTGLNGQPIRASAELRNAVAMTRPGTQLGFEVYRGGQRLELVVTTGELTEEKLSQFLPRAEVPELGMVIEELTEGLRREYDVDSGVIVTQMSRRGRAAAIGIRPGDIIIEVNGQAVTDTASFFNAFGEDPNSIRMIIQRGNQLLNLQSTIR